jgi:valyl-tRNA synthetase
LSSSETPTTTKQDQTIITELNELVKDITLDMDKYRFYLAAEKLYHYVWHTFADKIIEESKNKLKSDKPEVVMSIQYTLKYLLETSLILLHPFMPFITEEIWVDMENKNNKSLLMVTSWPKS